MSEVACQQYANFSADHLRSLRFQTTQTFVGAVGGAALGMIVGGTMVAARLKGVDMSPTTEAWITGGIGGSGLGVSANAIIAKEAFAQRRTITRELRRRRLEER